jgi:hypothetical protein
MAKTLRFGELIMCLATGFGADNSDGSMSDAIVEKPLLQTGGLQSHGGL